MNEHMHEGGEAMIALRLEHYRYGGTNQAGTDEIADPAIVAAGFSSRTHAMPMDMVMLDLMYAPTDNVTLMVMPHYMRHRMEMVGIDPDAAGGGDHGGHHGGHAIPFGEVHAHSTEGFGWKTEAANESGFAFGDRARATGWVSTLLGSDLGATARLEYVHEGKVEGHYNGAHNHTAPPDRQENYGGDTVTAGLGLNWLLPVPGERRPQLGAEIAVPLYQDLNGIQAPQDWRLSLSLSQAF